MSRQEFLQRLREALLGEVPGNVIEDNIRYYDDYINTEVRNGSTEEAVIASIGDPRLIAKTIMEANENAKERKSGRTYYESQSGRDQTAYEESGNFGRHMHFVDLNKWYWKVLGIVVVVLFFFLIASILTGIFALLMPLMGPILLVFLVIWIVRGMRR